MANTRPIVHKRTAVSGRLPDAANTISPRYIKPGELSVNLTDQKVHTSNGSVIFEVGANISTLSVQSISANGSLGTNGYHLVSNGTSVYWSDNRGYTGSVGFTGSIGFTGSQGAVGFTGSAGADGVIGYNGSVGFTGSQGEVGFTGSQGVGFTGSRGDVGFTGSRGDVGFTGSQGSVGFTGSQGVGFTGSQGVGFTGSQGVGFTGSKGETGSFGGAAFEYNFNTSTAAADPGLGNVSFSNTNLSLATTFYIDHLDALGANSYNYLQAIDDSSSTIKGTFRVHEKANVANYADFSIIGYHSEPLPSYFSVPVAWLTGATSFTNTLSTIITFARTGDRGDIGYTGSRGDVGFTGSRGDVGFTGSQGVVGFTGSQGVVGFTGSRGDVGFTGSQGVGFTGSRGDVGFTGSQGVGFTGSQGTTGFTGSAGPPGGSSAAYIVQTITSNTNASTSVDVYQANAKLTLTLPDPSLNVGAKLQIKNINNQEVTVVSAGGNIDGYSEMILKYRNSAIFVVATSANWIIL